jgi:hypothetical protein
MEASAKPLSTDQTAASRWRGIGQAEPWPEALLENFCLRMASQGMCVSRALMLCDRRYALEQISHGHNMADDRLRTMAVELFRHFVSQRSGIAGVH